jgi:hypothetical protein
LISILANGCLIFWLFLALINSHSDIIFLTSAISASSFLSIYLSDEIGKCFRCIESHLVFHLFVNFFNSKKIYSLINGANGADIFTKVFSTSNKVLYADSLLSSIPEAQNLLLDLLIYRFVSLSTNHITSFVALSKW